MLIPIEEHELLVFWVQLFTLLTFAHAFGYVMRRLGLPSVIDLGHRELALDRVADIHRLDESEVHCRSQPSNLTADLGDQARCQQAVANAVIETPRLRKPLIEMDRVAVTRKIRETSYILLGKPARHGKSVADLQAFDCSFSNARQ